MPYISKERREKLGLGVAYVIERLKELTIEGRINSGDVIYVIYRIVKEMYGEGRFETRSDGIKVFQCALMEYYRRVVAPYEDEKIQEHGDL